MSVSSLKAFTTEPKTRRHTKTLSISIERCYTFMEHLWELNLKDCSYQTLEFEFIQCFGTNEPRTIKRYLGIPEQVVKSQGSTKMIRMNRQSGKVAVFEYYNEKRIPAKKGLMEILGLITRYKQGNETRFKINHETMPYYTHQTTLNEHHQAENNQESKESQEALETIKEDLRVCSLYTPTHSLKEPEGVRGKGLGENPMFCEANRGESVSPMGFSPTNKEGGEIEGGENTEKKKNPIESTHTNPEKQTQTNKPKLGTCIQNRIQAELLLTQIQQATQNQKGERGVKA